MLATLAVFLWALGPARTRFYNSHGRHMHMGHRTLTSPVFVYDIAILVIVIFLAGEIFGAIMSFFYWLGF